MKIKKQEWSKTRMVKNKNGQKQEWSKTRSFQKKKHKAIYLQMLYYIYTYKP